MSGPESVVRVPDSLSSVSAFNALYMHSYNGSRDLPYHCSPWNPTRLFRAYCPGGFCIAVRGTDMGINFSSFPYVDVKDYNKFHGVGSAQKALKLMEVAIQQRGGDDGLNCMSCSYSSFAPRDFEKFDGCALLKRRNPGESGIVLDTCTAIVPDEDGVRVEKPCGVALDHFESMTKSVAIDASICWSSGRIPFLRKCETHLGITAEEVRGKIESHLITNS